MKSIIDIFTPAFKLFFIALLLGLAADLSAQGTLSVQGVLTKSDGTAVDDGNVNMTFSLYTTQAGGTPVYTETINNIPTISGVYNAILGLNGGVTAPFNTTYYLGVSVNGSAELAPRPRLTAAPYALSLLGNTNKFPSSGTVYADALQVAGGVIANVGLAPGTSGYSFASPGDMDGGMFSGMDNQVSFYANNVEKIRISNTLTTVYGDINITGSQSIDGNQTVAGNQTISNNQTVNGISYMNSYNATTGVTTVCRAKTEQGGNLLFEGYGFETAGGTQLYSGMACNDLGTVSLWSANQLAAYATSTGEAGVYLVHNLYLRPGVNYSGSGGSPLRRNSNGYVYPENSSRRFKCNIRPLEDDFSLILKSQPKIYNRPDVPGCEEVGYIAEEMDSIGLSKLVIRDDKGQIESYDYERMIVYVTEVVKMQHTAIEKLEAEVAALRAENAGLKTEKSDLKHKQETLQGQVGDLDKRLKALEATFGNR